MLRRLGSNFASRSIGPLLRKHMTYDNERHALFVYLGQVCDVDRGDDMSSKLGRNREEDKETEDIP